MPLSEVTPDALMRPADLPAWERAVNRAYGLQSFSVRGCGFQTTLFRSSSWIGKRWLSSAPYLTDGGVDSSRPRLDEADIETLQKALKQHRARYLLLKTRRNLFPGDSQKVAVDRSYWTLVLDLRPGPEHLWRNTLGGKVRNQTRKGLKANPRVCFGGAELLDPFYQVIAIAWRDLGTPTHSKRFYRQILEAFGDDAQLLVIYLKGDPVAAAMLLHCGSAVHHPFCCTLKRCRSMSINNVLYWKIIERASEQGFAFFDMGRSRRHQGTFSYKQSWGAVPIQLYYNYVHMGNFLVPTFDSTTARLSTNAWRRMPGWLANRCGPRLIRDIP